MGANMDVGRLPSVEILGVRVHGPTLAQAVDIVEEWIRRPCGRARSVVNTGFHGLWCAHQDPGFREVLNQADFFCPDGVAPYWLSRLQRRPLPARLPGPDLMEAVLQRANERGYRSYFYGDTDEVLAALKERVARRFPGAGVAGVFSPPFRSLSDRERAEHIERINGAKPDLLWVGLGCPKQERWIADNRERLRVPVVIGIGAVFRVQAGVTSRAPRWLSEAGFEWAWRLAAEPRKLWRRDLVDGPRFLTVALADAWKMRQSRRETSERV
jgi:N-acetylglucosaminyldiphosphoundecaprenol N-acetyl-beta-D-mannosaminyltransferase